MVDWTTMDVIEEFVESNGCITGQAGAPVDECVAHVGMELLREFVMKVWEAGRELGKGECNG